LIYKTRKYADKIKGHFCLNKKVLEDYSSSQSSPSKRNIEMSSIYINETNILTHAKCPSAHAKKETDMKLLYTSLFSWV